MSSNGVIFDLDGVLIDSGQFHLLAWYGLAERYGYEMNEEIFAQTFGMQNYQIIPLLAGRELGPSIIAEQSEWKEQRFRELADGKLKIFDGAERLVNQLNDNGFVLAIGSSTTRSNIEFILNNMPFSECFNDYVIGEDVQNGKPAPDTFLKAAEKLNLDPGNCVVIEDAIVGVQSGKAAGMRVIAVTTTCQRHELTEADIIIDGLTEISAGDITKLLC